jgi:hypothetical protein
MGSNFVNRDTHVWQEETGKFQSIGHNYPTCWEGLNRNLRFSRC